MAKKRQAASGMTKPRPPAMANATEVATGVVNLLRDTVVTALNGARDVGAEVGSVAVTAVRGSIRAAEEIGGDVGRLATNAAEGTIDAADRISAAAGRAVGNLVNGTIEGVKDIIAPGRHRPAGPAATHGGRDKAADGHRGSAMRKALARRPARSREGRSGGARTTGAA
jgi:hypothetical protein